MTLSALNVLLSLANEKKGENITGRERRGEEGADDGHVMA